MYMYLEALESPKTYRYNDTKYIIVRRIASVMITYMDQGMILFLNLLKPLVGKKLILKG